jgi:hypothetical protein
MPENRVETAEVNGRTVRIAYEHPAEPGEGAPVVAAVVTLDGQDYPMIVRGEDRGEGMTWGVAFGDLADEGRYGTFAEAFAAAHERVARDAAELARSIQDVGY